MNRTAILVQARMSSQRLPGKVVLPFAGEPAIVRMMERVARCHEAQHQLVVTSTHQTDDTLAHLCAARGCEVFRGSLEDVLGRFAEACPADVDVVVRLTGDCPLVDPGLVDAHVRAFRQAGPGLDYLSNAVERTFPDGLDVEVFTRAALEEAARAATEPRDREHVTPWIIRNTRRGAFTQAIDLAALRWTLDTEDDYTNISAVYEALWPSRPDFDRFDVYRLLVARPDLIRVAERSSLEPDELETWRRALTRAAMETA